MSWENWAAQCLQTESGVRCSHTGAVFGIDGSKWGSTGDIDFPCVADAIKVAKSYPQMPVTRLEINNKNFLILRATESEVMVKDGAAGATIAIGEKCVVMGLYNDASVQPGQNTKQVCDTRDKLNAVL